MLRHEAQGNHHEVLEPFLAQLLQHVVRVWLQPLHRANPALEAEGVVVSVLLLPPLVHFLHDQLGTALDLSLVRITSLHVALWDSVGREHNLHVLRGSLELVELLENQLRLCGEVTRMIVPVGYDRVIYSTRVPLLRILPDNLVQQPDGASCGGNGVLGVEGDDDQPVDAVRQDLIRRLLREGVPVSHPDVDLSVDPDLLELFLKVVSLLLCQLHDGRSSSDGLVCLP
mmetsp:Transcript_19664/g.65433  ORF Transcript_19664/g.65433 Transcript_19664/m.65433 type:complete len:228 (-) Transcript_19664:465-1148(-)